MAALRLFETPRYPNERSTKFDSLEQEQKYLKVENGKISTSFPGSFPKPEKRPWERGRQNVT